MHWDIPLTSDSLVCGPAEETQEYDVGCFQSECGFLGGVVWLCGIFSKANVQDCLNQCPMPINANQKSGIDPNVEILQKMFSMAPSSHKGCLVFVNITLDD